MSWRRGNSCCWGKQESIEDASTMARLCQWRQLYLFCACCCSWKAWISALCLQVLLHYRYTYINSKLILVIELNHNYNYYYMNVYNMFYNNRHHYHSTRYHWSAETPTTRRQTCRYRQLVKNKRHSCWPSHSRCSYQLPKSGRTLEHC